MSPSPYDWRSEEGDEYIWIEADEMADFRRNVTVLTVLSSVTVAGLTALNVWLWFG